MLINLNRSVFCNLPSFNNAQTPQKVAILQIQKVFDQIENKTGIQFSFGDDESEFSDGCDITQHVVDLTECSVHPTPSHLLVF